MGKRNLTLQLDDEVIEQAKVLAARRGTSVSGLVTRHLKLIVDDDNRYEEAKRHALESLAQAATEHRSVAPWTREELYDRWDRRHG